MMNMGELTFLGLGGVTLVGVLLSYIAARFALLSNWHWLTGLFRLLALWLVAAWMGYGTPLYVALAMFPLALVWSRLQRKLIPLLIVEVGIALCLAWHSQTPLLPIYLAALVLIDQCLARFALLQFASQEEPRHNVFRFLLCLGLLGTIVLGTHFQRASISKHLSNHSVVQTLDLVPLGAVWVWYQARELPATQLPAGTPPSVFWQSRIPATGEHCLLSFHGAAPEASLQGAAQAIALGARQAGWRVYALDHPGFGASPVPAATSNIDAWNPALHSDLLLAEMRREGCAKVGVIGHSQGVTEALRLLVSVPDLVGVWVLGAGLYSEEPGQADYWFNRFHSDRGLASPATRLDETNWQVVRDLYYLNQEYCSNTALGQAYTGATPLNYVTFDREHENLAATREKLWSCLNYTGKSRVALPTDHYFDSLSLGGTARIDKLVLMPRSAPAVIAALLPRASEAEADSP